MKENELSENIETAINTQNPVWLGVWGPEGLDIWLTVGQKPNQQPYFTSAVRTLEHLKYTYHGGNFWKPPLGPVPAWAQPKQVTSGWSLREVYFDEDGIPLAHRESKERNFCPRCGKRTPDLTTIHTCTPPEKA